MSFLNELAGFRPSNDLIKVELITGEPSLDFRKPTEGETDAARNDARLEAEHYFKEGVQLTVKQQEWVPKLRESFIKATVLATFLVHESENKNEGRRLLCQVAKYRPIIFETIYSQFIEKSVIAEVKDFADRVEETKKSSLMTGSDSID